METNGLSGETALNFSRKPSGRFRPLYKKIDVYDGTTRIDIAELLPRNSIVRLGTDNPNAFGVIISSPTWGEIEGLIKRTFDNFAFEFTDRTGSRVDTEEHFDNNFYRKVLPANVVAYFFLKENADQIIVHVDVIVTAKSDNVSSRKECESHSICEASLTIAEKSKIC